MNLNVHCVDCLVDNNGLAKVMVLFQGNSLCTAHWLQRLEMAKKLYGIENEPPVSDTQFS